MSIGDEYLSYSDDLIKAMGKSKGNVDTMIKMVSDYGSTAEKAIVKSGDYAVDIYQRFGQKGLKAVSNYGDDAIKLINRHGNDVIDIINTHGKDGIKAVKNYGDDAIKAVKKGVDPTNINKLADDLGIKPDSYGRRGIKNDKAAQQVLNSQFTAKKIASTKSFTDTYGSIAKSNGFKTADEFKSATMKTYDELEALGTLDNIKAMRNAIPDPTNTTVMQRVVAPKIAMEYLSGERTTITGSVAKFSDTQGLKTYTDVYNGLRLDYTGENLFDDLGTKDATMYAIRFTSDDTTEKIVKSVRSSELGNLGWEYPYTGTGFISSASKLDIGTKKPYSILEQGKTVIPEYVARNIDDGVALKEGAEMYKITDSGEEILYAIFDKEQMYFKRIGD